MGRDMQMIIRSRDFYENEQITRHLAKPEEQLIDPCTGCEHRKDCGSQHMACNQYKTYRYQSTSFNNVALWQAESKEPSKAIYNELIRRARK